MIRLSYLGAAILSFACGVCIAQNENKAFPESIVIARNTFIDIGPPFDFYELFKVESAHDGLSIERVLVTPPGLQCMGQPAKVESRNFTIHKTMAEFLLKQNPCDIPDKELHRELKRSKRGLVFSGADVTMQVSCEGKDRQLRMDILDRDLFDPKPNIPQHTSWTMSVLHELDQAIGPGVLDKPIFAMDNDPHAGTAPNSVTIQALREGEYNNLFSRGSSVSEVVHEADLPPESLPSVELTSASPFMPLSPELPKYPPIARAARLEGSVNLTFDVDSLGKVQYIEVTSGTQQRMLQGAAEAAAKTWTFPEAAFGKKIQATLGFKLNCQFTVDTNVN